LSKEQRHGQESQGAGGRLDTPDYRRVMGEFLRGTGFQFLNKDDRAAAVRLLPRWEEINAWRSSLPHNRQQALNNPREVWAAFLEHHRKLGDPEAKHRPAKRHRRQYPSLLEQMEALAEQLQFAEERAERAERESTYFAELMTAVAEKAKLSEDAIAEIRSAPRTRASNQRISMASDRADTSVQSLAAARALVINPNAAASGAQMLARAAFLHEAFQRGPAFDRRQRAVANKPLRVLDKVGARSAGNIVTRHDVLSERHFLTLRSSVQGLVCGGGFALDAAGDAVGGENILDQA
jgi:hypothetical protein